MNMKKLNDYAELIGEEKIDFIRSEASALKEKSVAHVSSTYYGGGVAEILGSQMGLLNDAGVKTEWRLLKGSPDFFNVTKKMHNSLQGAEVSIGKEERQLYEETNAYNAAFTHLEGYDAVIVNDPQPLPLVTHYSKKLPWMFKPFSFVVRLKQLPKNQVWVWRCHIDLSRPYAPTWDYLKQFVEKYDAVVVSEEQYRTALEKPEFVIAPAIDPFSTKNAYMNRERAEKLLERHGVDTSIPIVAQVSRFDVWKDPLGVIRAFKRMRKNARCQLVLLGNMATDDPEGEKIYAQVLNEAQKENDIHAICLQSDQLVNALQRTASVVVQKSLREGFGITISEALWKGTPVVASRVGGIPLQVQDGVNGYLVENEEQCASRILHLLKNKKKAEKMGRNGRELVKEKFLMTRLVFEEVKMLKNLFKAQQLVKKPSFLHLQTVVKNVKKLENLMLYPIRKSRVVNQIPKKISDELNEVIATFPPKGLFTANQKKKRKKS